MFQVFKYVEKFFSSLTNYIGFNDIFITFVGLFIVAMVCVFVSTSHAYESKLIKSIDRFNAYFIDNPHINEDNLVAFNEKMKSNKVPKQLRKSWQQFVLYREDKASSYMSFENCVSNPIKHSSYKRDIKIFNFVAYIFAAISLILNCFYCYETADLANVLQSVLLTPAIILLLNYCSQIYLNVRHSAIVSDLFQNYQYFEVNIDKATETLPEYVDYEVLFDKNEIKKGIPILYQYLQKRAEEEQRELERARLKNVEHEKFNFDESGVAASLVLDRAMQEAENYIAERKKYTQDTQQINSDLTQEDINFREITKEYNRQMQVSKETFANLKTQLEEASSTIEANYLKKQQQQELDRQRNLERDYDTATERHKKVVESFHAELDAVDNFIAQSRENLESAMKSEFSTYSSKVYDEAKKVAEEREIEKTNKLKEEINRLEELLASKEQELAGVYEQNEEILKQYEDVVNQAQIVEQPTEQTYEAEQYEQYQPIESEPEQLETEEQPEELTEYYQNSDSDQVEETYDYQPTEDKSFEEQPSQENYEEQSYDYSNYNEEFEQENVDEDYNQYFEEEPTENTENVEDSFEASEEIKESNETSEEVAGDEKEFPELPANEDEEFEDEDLLDFEYLDEITEEETPKEVYELPIEETSQEDNLQEEVKNEEVSEIKEEVENQDSTDKQEESIAPEKVASRRGRPRKVVEATEDKGEVVKKRPGRPKKEKTEDNTPKKPVGRPRKETSTETKEDVKVEETPTKRPGRPKKVQTETKESEAKVDSAEPKKRPGRPKKEATAEVEKPKKSVGRPRKNSATEKTNEEMPIDLENIDEYIRKIDSEIAEEHAKMKESQKELAKNARIKRKK